MPKNKRKHSCHTIELTRPGENTPNIIMDVSEIGGRVDMVLNTRKIDSPKIAIKQALDKAKSYLESIDYTNMEPTGSLRENNTITVTFVPKDGGVLLYPDFIKVEVALDTGEIVGLNTLAYLTSHTDRDLPEPSITEKMLEKV